MPAAGREQPGAPQDSVSLIPYHPAKNEGFYAAIPLLKSPEERRHCGVSLLKRLIAKQAEREKAKGKRKKVKGKSEEQGGGGRPPVFCNCSFQEALTPMILQVQILRNLRAHFSQVRTLKGLQAWTWRERASWL